MIQILRELFLFVLLSRKPLRKDECSEKSDNFKKVFLTLPDRIRNVKSLSTGYFSTEIQNYRNPNSDHVSRTRDTFQEPE